MTIWESALLGLVQGLTEFLPVSSSGHLELAKALMNDSVVAEAKLHFTVVLHAATALATLLVFRRDIASIFRGLIRWESEAVQFTLAIIISMIPAGLIGLFMEDYLEEIFSGSLVLVGFMLLITGVLLFAADRAKETDQGVNSKSALIIGIAQAIAIMPGISRSGATIATSVLLGLDRARAARFSFLMVVPLILGKMLMDIRSMSVGTFEGNVEFAPLATGFVVAFVTGVLACRAMIALVKRAKLSAFAYYCFAVGAAAMIWKLFL